MIDGLDAPAKIKAFDRTQLRDALGAIEWNIHGKVVDVLGNVVEAHLPRCALGGLVEIQIEARKSVLAEVVSVHHDRVKLLPYTDVTGISAGARVSRQKVLDRIPVSKDLLGRVIDPFMNDLLDQGQHGAMHGNILVHLERPAPNPLSRQRVDRQLGLGVRAIDGLLSFGDGQRLGIMAGSGVGKSVLLGMMARQSDADVNVIGLIGERGREVREFLERDLGSEGLSRSVVVVVTGDQSPLMKVRAAKVVTAVAEYFSSLGNRVLLMMDSLTRVAMAQREIGISVGEQPTAKGYTPSVFSLLPRILERAGPQPAGCGNISGIYTVLVDGDDFNDPIADSCRSILDGQINLSRSLASRGHYPAIDISTSVSRVMYDIVSKDQWSMSMRIKGLMGTYLENFDLVQIGAYQPGANPKLDEALNLMPSIESFLKQEVDDVSDVGSALEAMRTVLRRSHGGGAVSSY